MWNVFAQPLGFVVFCVAAFAEAARLPFDLPEAEQELVGGYHTEYSGIKLMMYLVADFLHMITASFLIVILFLGGWHFWGLTGGLIERRRPGNLARGHTADHRAAGQGDGSDLVFHACPLELAAVPLRPVDGHRLEGDDSVWIGEPGGCRGLGGIRRAFDEVCRLAWTWGLVLIGWIVIAASWLFLHCSTPPASITVPGGD